MSAPGGRVVAEGALFADVEKELGRGRAAVDRVEYPYGGQVGLLHALAEPSADGQLALADVHVLPEHTGLFLDGVHAYLRTQVPVYLAARQGVERTGDGREHLIPAGGPAVEDLYGRGCNEILIVFGETDVADVLRRLLREPREPTAMGS